jgi:large repetitive protein
MRVGEVPFLSIPLAARVMVALLAGVLLALGLTTSAEAAKKKTGIGRPALTAPAQGAEFESAPTFAWNAARNAESYEFQLSADRQFRSIVDHGAFPTMNRYATVDRTLPDGTYWWRVRAVNKKKRAGKWSVVRSFDKRWTSTASILGPFSGANIAYPSNPLVLRWEPVPYASRYIVTIATDPSLAQPVVTQSGDRINLTTNGDPVETAATSYALPIALAPGTYYWAVTPVNARGLRGRRSSVQSFAWSWDSRTAPRVTDLHADPRVDDYQFSWDPIPGAARYEVEVSTSSDFAAGSRVCCTDPTTGTSLSPKDNLANNHYYWRVRAFDIDGNAGVWNYGPEFTKTFDNVLPTIPNVRVRDNVGTLPPGSSTGSPVLEWDPAPGAHSYDVHVVKDTPTGCNWTQTTLFGDGWFNTTATTAWTPLGGATTVKPIQWSGIGANDGNHAFVQGQAYCVRIRARADLDTQNREVVSDWTVVGSKDNPAFVYDSGAINTCSSTPAAFEMPADCYIAPQGEHKTRMPLFTWRAIPGAASYWVVVARDPQFTDIMDEGLAAVEAYAPRLALGPRTYPDETTTYYYAVYPASTANGGGVTSLWQDNSPHTFEKRSISPDAIGPKDLADVPVQPTFRWTPAEGAKHYQLQVSADPSFGDLIDNVTTNSTAYTSSSTYPADTILYWRVRATDATGIGLTWSPTATFRRRLPVPAFPPLDPGQSEIPPVIAWSGVQGATSYDVHLEEPDGDQKTFDGHRSIAGTFTKYFGTGVWKLSVRAAFPTSRVNQETPGPWSQPRVFTRVINPPASASGVLKGGKTLISWNPSPVAKQYRVQIATTNSFATPLVNVVTDNTSFAPDLRSPTYRAGSALYWRVAVVDDGNNLGGWASGTLRNPQRLRITVRGKLRAGKRSRIPVTVRDAKGRRIVGAAVSASGGGIAMKPKSTRRKGKIVLRLRPRVKGKVTIKAAKSGYDTGQRTLKVR